MVDVRGAIDEDVYPSTLVRFRPSSIGLANTATLKHGEICGKQSSNGIAWRLYRRNPACHGCIFCSLLFEGKASGFLEQRCTPLPSMMPCAWLVHAHAWLK